MTCKFIFGSAVMAALLLAPAIAYPATKPPPKATAKAIQPQREMLYATGEGAMSNAKEQPNRAKAYLEAKAYAKMSAIASLVQLAKGTIIEYTAKGEDYVAETLIKQEIKGVLDSVQVVEVSKRSVEKDILVAVTVRAPKPLPPKTPPAPKEPAPSKLTPPVFQPTWVAKAPQSPQRPVDGFTSVIIDAQGLGVCRSMSPKILRPDGSEIWGTVKSDYDFISEYGIVAYANSRADASQSRRAGDRPLVIRAVKCGRSASECDVVISAADAQALEDADRKSRFLDDFRVIIVVDRINSFAGFKPGKRR